MRRALILTLFVAALFLIPAPFSLAANLSILSLDGYTRTDADHMYKTFWEFTYQVKVKNRGAVPLPGVFSTVKSTTSHMAVSPSLIFFPPIPAGGTSQGLAPLAVQADKRNNLDLT